MIFEKKHSLLENEFSVSRGKAITFHPHLHRAFECFLQISGQTVINIDGARYELKAKDAVLIFPFQLHSYEAVEQGEHRIIFFSPEMVSEFSKRTDKHKPDNNLFSFSLQSDPCLDNAYLKKAFCYQLCGEFDRGREYVSSDNELDESIIRSLLLYVEAHYLGECSLKAAASEIGYDYAYISKFFKRKVGLSFKTYVNTMRVGEGKRLLLSSSLGIFEISEACGFTCPRTFNREFLSIVGISPSEYRKRSYSRALQ